LTLPGDFQLIFVNSEVSVPVTLVWQRGFAAGVAFNHSRP
jgi:hypothetical protein